MELGRGRPGDGFDALAPDHGLQPPAGALPSPVADILAVEGHRVLIANPVAEHAPGEFHAVAKGQIAQAVFGSGHQALANQLRLVVLKALLAFQENADGVVHHKGRMGQGAFRGVVQLGDKAVILIKRHLVGVGEHRHIADFPAGVVADVHAGGNLQHRFLLSLAGIGEGRQLGIPKGIHNAVIAHPVAGAEILVGGIVEHAPAEAARMLPAGIGGVQHPHMPQGMLLALGPGVIGFGGEHVAVVLGDQKGLLGIGADPLLLLAARVIAGVGEVVKGVHILQQLALFQIPHPRGCPAGIQLVGQLVGLAVEGVVVHALVDANAPEDDAGMVAVLGDHFLHVPAGLLLPGLVADVLPARNLRKDQQTDSVTFINKILALRIVAGADGVAVELLLQNPGILPLQ